MRRILYSSFMVLAVAAVAGYATWSYFSDTETSTGNNFTAGSIDLKVDSKASYNGQPYTTGTWGQVTPGVDITNEKFFSFADVKPGDQGENTISLHVINNDARACVIFDKFKNDDNGLTEPEGAVDTTGGVGQGDLAQEINFFAWADDGDNLWEGGELPLFSNVYGPASDVLMGKSYDLGTLTGSTTKYIGLYWCYGALTVDTGTATLSCSGQAVTNKSQSDSLIGDVWFYVEQARNNTSFACPIPRANLITANDLETSDRATAKANGKWFFYNDTNDTIMSINQFGSDSNEMDSIGGVEGAKMTLADSSSRYNIATYRYSDVKLSDIGSLKYRIYDASASAETPYLHFNIDFFNTDTWQRRLVQVPTSVTPNTWSTIDALSGMWMLSGGNWPAGGTETGSNPGSNPKSWASILADYPNAETRSTDSFFGVRVGHPGPSGETGYVDWIEFDGEIADFGM